MRNQALSISGSDNGETAADQIVEADLKKAQTVKESMKSIDKHDKLTLDLNSDTFEGLISDTITHKGDSNTAKQASSPEMINEPGLYNKTIETRLHAYTPEMANRLGIKDELNVTQGKKDIVKQCEVCQKTYKNIKSFTRHSCKPKQDMIKKKTCNICDKSFKTNEHFRQHIRSHTGEKPFLCMSCGKSFSQQGNLIKHMRIHAGTRLFLCEICSRPFMTKGALNEHIRVHSDVKRFQCEICKKYFRHKHGLDNHQRKRKYPCNVRKYGENKSSKKRKKVKSRDSSTKNKKVGYVGKQTRANSSYTVPVTKLNKEIEKLDGTCIQESHEHAFAIQNQVPGYVPESYTPNKNNADVKAFVYSNMLSIEHSIQRLQNFTEVILPRLQTENPVQKYNREHEKIGTADVNTCRYKELPNTDLTTDKEVRCISARRSDIRTEIYQTGRPDSDERENRTRIEKILMQYYNNEINPMYFEKDSNDVVNDNDLKSYITGMNSPSLNMQDVKEPLSDKENQEIIVKHTYENSEDSVSAVPVSYQANLPSLSDCLPSVSRCDRVQSTKEIIPKGRGHLNPNDTSDRNINVTEATTKGNSSELDYEDIDTNVAGLNDQHYERNMTYETDLCIVPFCGGDSASNTDNVCADEESSISQGNGELLNVRNETDSVAKLSRHRTPVELTEEEVRHIIEKARRKDFKCENCDRNFSNEYCLNVHSCKSKYCEASESKRASERKLCPLCKRSYANKYLLAYHSCRPNNKSEKQKKTSEANQRLQKKDCFQNMETAGGKETPCTRLRSGKMKKSVIKSNDKLTAGTRIRKRKNKTNQTVVKDREVNDICDLSSQRNKKKSISHKKIEVNVDQELGVMDEKSTKTDKNMICEVCGKTYKNKSNLKNHSCKPPLKESKTCKICGKVFNLKVHLQIHLRIHTGEMPFLCKICGKQFNQGANLMKHLRIHNPEKLFKCEICDRRFTQKGALTEHRIVHTNFKPYVCFKCDKSFRHKHGLQNHLNRKFPCDCRKKATVKVRKARVSEFKQKRGRELTQQNSAQTDESPEVKLQEENTIPQNQPTISDLVIAEDDRAPNHQNQSVQVGLYTSEYQQIIDKLDRPNSVQNDQVHIQMNVTEGVPGIERCEPLVQQPQDRWALSNGRPQFFITESLTYENL